MIFSLSLLGLASALAQQTNFIPDSPGAASARAAHEAGIYAAEASFRWDLARIAQLDSDFRPAIAQAWSDRSEQRQLVHAQYQSRIDLLSVLGDQQYAPALAPNQFSASVTNPFLPLVPGRTLIYERQTNEGLERIESSTLPGVTYVNGIPCSTVREYETLDGVLMEDTLNWLSQRSDGSVWYFGEISRTYEEGFLSTLEGSWRYGENGAQPGILMPAHPSVGQSYRQEFLLGVAEDVAHVTSTDKTVTVSGKTITDCVETLEESPIEPDDLGTKVYAVGVGVVREVDLATGQRLELIEIRD